MNLHNRASRWALLPERIRGMFNLNDPRWGRGDDKGEGGQRPEPERPSTDQPQGGGRGRGQNSAGQPPDLDELWQDLNRKLGGLFGGRNGGGRGPTPGGGNGGGFRTPGFNPGAGGEHKKVRGFVPTKTFSAHHVEDARFRAILDAHLTRERAAIDAYVASGGKDDD